MTITETSPSRTINIETLSFTSGAHLLLKRTLRDLPVGGRLGVNASAPDFATHLRGWCREQGHEFVEGDEPDFALASFLLSVLGEGTFLNLLWFLERHAPDPVTRQIARLVGQDEARHVAFGVGHLQYQLATDPALRGRLAMAVTRRHEALSHTTGLNEEVFDALILMAAGSWRLEDVAAGYARAQTLKDEMRAGRKARLEKLGFSDAEAAELSALHTRNFM